MRRNGLFPTAGRGSMRKMKNKRKKREKDEEFCHYGVAYSSRLLDSFKLETDGVRKADDIEYIHRMRVASRRLRASLPLFSACFPRRRYRTWIKEIGRITKALGRARDLDVQIEFLESYLKDLRNKEENGDGEHTIPVNTGGDFAGEIDVGSPSIPEPVLHEKNTGIWRRIRGAVTGIGSRVRHGVIKKSGPGNALIRQDRRFKGINSRKGVEVLLLRLKQERALVQPVVIRDLDILEKKDIILEMEAVFRQFRDEGVEQKSRREIVSDRLCQTAGREISGRLTRLLRYETSVYRPDAIRDHHSMRIEAKKLRYTMETFVSLYGRELKDPLKAIKGLQELLGELHDCDVWTGYLPRFLEQERDRTIEYFGNDEFFGLIEPGIRRLMADRHQRRDAIYLDFVAAWKDLHANGVLQDLIRIITAPSGKYGMDSGGRVLTTDGTGISRVAVIGNINGNLPLLEAILADARNRGADLVIGSGNLASGGAFPEETIDRAGAAGMICIMGRDDRAMLKSGPKKDLKTSAPDIKEYLFRWTMERLNDDQRKYLQLLPDERRLNLSGSKILITRWKILRKNLHLRGPEKDEQFARIGQGSGAQVIICSDIHQPFSRRDGGVWVISPGDAEFVSDDERRGSYTLIQTDPFDFFHIRIPYDVLREDLALRERMHPAAGYLTDGLEQKGDLVVPGRAGPDEGTSAMDSTGSGIRDTDE
jgi:CHAD domain-containing protein/predicted phosphodiesterase